MLRSFVLLLATLILPLVSVSAGEKVRPITKGQTMDYGPFLFYTVERKLEAKKFDFSNKGVTIKAGPQANINYDTELLRVHSAWTGAFLDLTQTNIGQLKGDFAARIPGTLAFSAPPTLGWSKTAEFTDPRPLGHGPIPREIGYYKGIYAHGNKAILSYNIYGIDVLELPGFENGVFTRTIQIGKRDAELHLRVHEKSVVIPANTAGNTVKIVCAPEPKVEASDVDLTKLFNDFPPRFAQAVTTVGVNGKEEGPFVVDTLTLPDDNPFGAWMRPTALDFFSDGRVAVSTMNGDVWVVSGVHDTLQSLTWKRFAAGMFEPLGLRVVDDVVYVTTRERIVRLHDMNKDGEADFYENFNSDTHTFDSYHDFTFDLQTDPEGNFYFVKGGNQVGWDVDDHSVVVKVSKDGTKRDYIARGFRAPNGMCVGPEGQITVGDNQGHWTPASKISWVKNGGFYGFRGDPRRKNPNHLKQTPETMDPPLCWIPHSQDNSSGGQVWVPKNHWGPLAGQLLHLSYGKGTLHGVLVQDAGGVMQGGTWKFPLEFASGIQRARFNPKDGHLYLCGLRGWQTAKSLDGCVQRVRYTGKPVYAPVGLIVQKYGIDITFSQPIDGTGIDAETFGVEQWQYKWSADYGSPDFSIEDPTKKGQHDPVTVKSVKLSDDKKTVTLEIPDIKPVMQMGIKGKIKAADGTPMNVEIYNTINKIP